MSISKYYESGNQKNNILHFAAIVNIAIIDGEINDDEKKVLLKLADKLDIGEEDFKAIVMDSKSYPIANVNSKEERLEHLFDLFKMIFADHEVDTEETKLIKKYAIGLGCVSGKIDGLIDRSIKIFSGDIDFEDYKYLIGNI